VARSEDNKVYEALLSFPRGMHSGIDPFLLNENYYARGINIEQEDGYLRPRAPFELLKELPSGKFQGMFTYRLRETDRIVVAISGNIYVYRVDTGGLTTFSNVLKADADHMFFCQADRYAIIQDGVVDDDEYDNMSWPFILYEDAQIDQTDETSEYYIQCPAYRVPKGGPMAYAHGRLFVAVDYLPEQVSPDETSGTTCVDNPPSFTKWGRTSFLAGDIVKATSPSDVLRFTETNYLAEGGAFKVPSELGIIYALDVQRNSMGGTGFGPLIAICDRGVAAYSIQASRRTWKDIETGTVLFFNSGSRSPRSIAHVNNDLLYRSLDGIRSIKTTTSQVSGSSPVLSNEPISDEISAFLDPDTLATLPFVSMSFLQDHLLCTTNPVSLSTGETGFLGLVSMDTSPLSALGESSPAVYNGKFNGACFLQVGEAYINSVERHIVAIRSEDGAVKISYLGDYVGKDYGTSYPPMILYTRGLWFKSRIVAKDLQFIDVCLKEVVDNVTISGYYRWDGRPVWQELTSASVSASGSGGSLCRIRLTPKTDGDCDSAHRAVQSGYCLELCLKVGGPCILFETVIGAISLTSDDYETACGTFDLELNDTVGYSTDTIEAYNFQGYSA